jgi:hypothetical protein
MWTYRSVVTFLAFAALAGGGIGAAAGEIHRNATTPRSPQVRTFEKSSFHTFRAPRVLSGAPLLLSTLHVRGHGGTAVIDWYAGSWSSLAPQASDAVGLFLDGAEVAETVAAGAGGVHYARPGILRWVGHLSRGPHVVSLQLVQATGPLVLPMVVDGVPIDDGLVVTEHVRS